MNQSVKFPAALFFAYILFFTVLGIQPYSRSVWFAENLPILLIVFGLFGFYLRGVRFSNTAYAMMSFLVFMHTLGGHYTFERVPFDWFNHFFGFERNMYDRVAHFTVGFYAYPVIEWAHTRNIIRSKRALYFFSVCTIAAVAMSYEIIEWIYAVTSDPASGNAFLGSQGDVWDAQKDMLMDTLGAFFAVGIYELSLRFKKDQA